MVFRNTCGPNNDDTGLKPTCRWVCTSIG